MKDSNEVESRSSNAIANQPAQLQSKGAALAPPSQARFAPIQMVEDEEPLQGKFATVQLAELEEPLQGKFGAEQKQATQAANNTGMPNQLKSGIESLSGMSMDHVKVHRNSDKPAQLNAHAYAQGSDIHLGPGQEKHLPHEAWHTVQQKQGRVQPTRQMKENVPVNDDQGLENEADVMGAKAMSIKSTPCGLAQLVRAELSPIKQLKGNDDRKFDKIQEHENAAEVEAITEPMTKKELAKVQGDKGENRKIDIGGELTLGAKFKGLFGMESTYSKFLNKASQFNSTNDVIKKMQLLAELKPLAREWLKRHEEDVHKGMKGDGNNEEQKLATVNGFLRQTTTNYPRIVTALRQAANALEAFRASPVANQSSFHSACENYKIAVGKYNFYKNNFPPSVNLMYLSEVAAIDKEFSEFKKTDSLSVGEIDTKLGFKVLTASVGYDVETAKLYGKGKFSYEGESIKEVNGEVILTFNSKGGFDNIELQKGTCIATTNGVEINLTGISYNYAGKEFVIESGEGSTTILEHEVKLKVKDASLTKKGFDYKLLRGEIKGNVGCQNLLDIIDPEVTMIKDESVVLAGSLGFQIGDISNVSGRAILRMDSALNVTDVEIRRGAANLAYAGASLKLDGIKYTYAASKFFAKEASGEVTILDKTFGLTVEEASYSEKGFDFTKMTGKLPNLDYGFFSLSETTISYDKKQGAYEGKSTYSFNTAALPEGFNAIKTSGDVNIKWDPKTKSSFSIKNGALDFNLLGQSGKVEEFEFESTNKTEINAKKVEFNIGISDFNKTITGENIKISEKGFVFDQLMISAAGEPISMGIISVIPSGYGLKKDGEGYHALVAGGVNLDLPEYLGVTAKGGIKGLLQVNLKNPTDSLFVFEQGKAEVEAANPFAKISDLFGDDWGKSEYSIGASIPVFPGVSAVFGFFLKYGAEIGKEPLSAVLELSGTTKSGNLTINVVPLKFVAAVEAGIFGGVKAGYDLLASLALLLKAYGIIKAEAEVGYKRTFKLGEGKAEKKVKDDDGFKYSFKGDVSVGASLSLVATALYFFRKEFELKLGEKSLGSFEFTNDKETKPDASKGGSLASKEQLEGQIDPALKEEYESRKLAVDELLGYDFTKRFNNEEKEKVLDTIKSAEKSRKDIHNATVSSSPDSNVFDDVAFVNWRIYNGFIDKRCGWDLILAETKKLQSIDPNKVDGEYKSEVLSTIRKLGEGINLASDFVSHYDHRVTRLISHYGDQLNADGTLTAFKVDIERKKAFLVALNEFKAGYLHSQFWGDEVLQKSNLETERRILGLMSSKYQSFATAYNVFAPKVRSNIELIEKIQANEEHVYKSLRRAHEEKEAAKAKK